LSIQVVIAATFQSATGGIESVEVEGKTLGQCLNEAVKKFPGLQKLWFKSENQLAHYLLVLINGENTSQNKLNLAVKDGDQIYPMLMIGGG
jgi:molybdopterin converting factor small subunit